MSINSGNEEQSVTTNTIPDRHLPRVLFVTNTMKCIVCGCIFQQGDVIGCCADYSFTPISEQLFCSRGCDENNGESLSIALLGWNNDGTEGPEDWNNSKTLLIDWFSMERNCMKWQGCSNENEGTKVNIATAIAL